MEQKWTKREISNNRTILSSKLVEDDPRKIIYEENYEIREYGITKNSYKGIDQLQFWIDKNVYNEVEKIKEFNEKCKIWDMGEYVEDIIILSIDDDINFDLFKFVKDDDFEKNYEKHLLTYDNKEVYIKTNNIETFDVENIYNQKCIRLQYDNIDKKLIDFVNKFENHIKEIVINDRDHYGVNIEHDFSSIVKDKETKYIELKVKKQFIESKTYSNCAIYIKCNRIWDLDEINDKKIEKWGVSLNIDKIIENY